MDGLFLQQDGNVLFCRIDTFTESLQKKISTELAAIAYGSKTIAELPDHYSYKETLLEFLNRYKTKSEEIQKGMIGELLCHIMIPDLLKNLTSISIYFNKEERSIKKGFDIIYCDLSEKSVWYSEVKSGHKNKHPSSDVANAGLLSNALADLKEKLSSDRRSIWDSALIDVALVLHETSALNVKKLLATDSPIQGKSKTEDKNAILISVLYEDPRNSITLDSLKEISEKISNNKTFKAIIVFSIQKQTYEKVALFLEQEASK